VMACNPPWLVSPCRRACHVAPVRRTADASDLPMPIDPKRAKIHLQRQLTDILPLT
jgi:hypothetical protein